MNKTLARGCCVAPVWVVLSVSQARAQNVVVQQPVIGQFNVNTVVSVPDRGSVLLGGVSSSQIFSDLRGPYLPSSRQFRSATQSTARVHVFIHNFEAMDRAVLAAAGSHPATVRSSVSARRGDARLTGMAAHAHHRLTQRHEMQRFQQRVWQGQ